MDKNNLKKKKKSRTHIIVLFHPYNTCLCDVVSPSIYIYIYIFFFLLLGIIKFLNYYYQLWCKEITSILSFFIYLLPPIFQLFYFSQVSTFSFSQGLPQTRIYFLYTI